MNMNFLITLGLAFLSFVVPAVCYSVMARKSNFNRKASLTNTAFLPLFAVLLPLMLLAYFFLYNGNDFIGSFNLWQIIIPFAGALMISAVGVYPRLERWFPLILILAVALSAAVIPDSALRFIPALEQPDNHRGGRIAVCRHLSLCQQRGRHAGLTVADRFKRYRHSRNS